MIKHRQPIKKNILGFKFGHLLVTQITEKRTSKKGIIYRCLCDCGNERLVSADSLKRKKVTRCVHCSKIYKTNNILNEVNKQNLSSLNIENTKISLIERKRKNSNNTSGYKGVVFDRARKKWRAQLVFQKKCYNLGRFSNLEDAVKARHNAELKIYCPFIEKHINKNR